jgi:hypothetical protein
MSVHDVDVNHLRAAALYCTDLLAEPGKVCR